MSNAGLAKQPAFSSYYGPVYVKASSTVAYYQASITAGTSPATTHVVEFQNLPCEVAQEMDRKMDNDDLGSGKAIASGGACTAGNIVPFYAVAL